MSKHVIPKRIRSYLKRLEISYLSDNDNKSLEVVRNSHIKVDEETDYDNYNGGSHGHTVNLFLSADNLKRLGNLQDQNVAADKILADLRECSRTVSNEYIQAVNIDLLDDTNPDCKIAIPPLGVPSLAPEGLGIWQHGYIRVFVSHKVEFRHEVGALKDSLKKYGISCFVAHDTIEPLEEWEDQIRKGLFSMEVLLAFLTDDFQTSKWTDQEVGVAIGRGIPIIPLKMQSKDAHGFMAKIQQVQGDLLDLDKTVIRVRKTIAEKIDREGRLKAAAIEAFANSTSYNEARDTFEILKEYDKFNDDEVSRLIEAYNFNSQLYGAAYLYNQRFIRFINKISSRTYQLVEWRVQEIKDTDDDIPF